MHFYKNKLKVGDNTLTVVTINQEDGETTQVVEKVVPTKMHHIHILDRSGSMRDHINTLVDQMQKTIEFLREEDILSVLWFASPGQYRTILKGAKKSPELPKLLDTLRSVMGTTCFSDPLNEAKNIVEELAPLCPNCAITLFTDGQAVTPWNEQEEERKSIEIIKSLKNKILAFNSIGFGSNYSQSFLRELSSISEFGVFTHSSEIEDYATIFKNNFDRIVEGKIEQVHIEYGLDIEGVYLNRKFTKMEKLEMYLSRLDRNKNQFFLVSKKGDFQFFYNDKEYFSKDITEETAEPTVRNFLYSYAYGLYYNGKRRESLEVLSVLRDKALLDSHMSAFTFDECAAHLASIEKAVFSTSERMKEGEAKANYLPPKDAFCVMDVLNMLAKEDAFYLPFHKEADKYSRIGKKTVDTYNLFEASKEPVVSPFSEFVFNKERVNLSIRFNIPGKVKLNPREAEGVGLPSEVEAHQWRNNTFIKDGTLNIKRCIALIPVKLYQEIQSKRKICEELPNDKELSEKYEKEYGTKFILVRINFSRIPIINATYNEDISPEKIFRICSKLLNLECYQKYLNHYWKNFEEKATATQMKIGFFENMSSDQIKVLENHGIDKNGTYVGVNRETPKNSESDFYETREFQFVFKGVSSLPSVKEVTEKVAAKKTTFSVEKMNEAHLTLLKKARDAGIDLGSAIVQTRDFLRQEILDTKYQIFSIRSELCAIKMAKLLNGDSFEGFTPDKNQNLAYTKNGETLYVKMKRTKEYY